MQKRLSTKARDEHQIGRAIVQLATSNDDLESVSLTQSQRSMIAAALGKLGGRKGGLARAARLSDKRKSDIARKAAQARWAKEVDHDEKEDD